ncbi:hypothetical protein Q4Q34_16310 [Flavivirga abyssicola]|uniref:hypothetical protein n=1 Tax=Flavivirga abyssicola TaxID=3063533 RepID=UPI0026DF384D|nr:hypothetical protein [Flavivirga sp. MEBiC07777]WVK12780.1 hypothetical protein Q4Q34_16310 [Flavivirga sp. MEBiC07777]
MKKPTLTFMLFCFISMSYAQVGIGTVTPNNSSVLDVQSTNKGVLLPRLTNAQKNNIPSPATGLMVYDTTNKCTSVNIGTPFSPDWECLNKTDNATIPTVIVSNTSLVVDTSNDREWLDVPDLSATFTILEDETIKIDWTLFSGQLNSSTDSGFAQMFTILEINGANDVTSSNYLPMIHNPGGDSFRLLMNNSTFSHAITLNAGTYTVKVKVYMARFLGTTTSVEIGSHIGTWSGGNNMTAQEKLNAASNKLLITFL